MKRFGILYKDDHVSKGYKYMVIIAESSQDADDFFFKNYSGVIVRRNFIGYA